MPIRFTDPFIDPLANLNLAVNRYAQLLKDGGRDPATPLSYGPDLKEVAGTWRRKLAAQMGRAPRQLWVEIGCHNGNTTLEIAGKRPDLGMVGIDITFKRVVKTATKAGAMGLSNVHSVLCNAMALSQIFTEGEIDGLILFFPDPWVRKKSQRKNRLLTPEFAAQMHGLIAPGGFFWFKTDQLDYFEEGADALQRGGFRPAVDEHARPVLPVADLSMTTFEAHFSSQGIPSYGGCWHKDAKAP